MATSLHASSAVRLASGPHIASYTPPIFTGSRAAVAAMRPRRRLQQNTKAAEIVGPIADLDIDWSDPDTLIGASGAFLGLVAGLAIPIFFVQREKLDESRLEELRALNRETFKQTGEYLSPVRIRKSRSPCR
jgi:hypothetical protein